MELVTLDWAEHQVGAQAGQGRRIRRWARDEPEPWGRPPGGDGFGVDIDGCLAEMAVAKYLGIYWSGAGLGGDVQAYEVRSTRHLDGHLIVHDYDPDAIPFVLVLVASPNYHLAGWLAGADAKRKAWWRTDVRVPAYFAPQGPLEPMATLAAAAKL